MTCFLSCEHWLLMLHNVCGSHILTDDTAYNSCTSIDSTINTTTVLLLYLLYKYYYYCCCRVLLVVDPTTSIDGIFTN